MNNSEADRREAERRAEVLDELVHDQASQEASDAINEGRQFDFLLARGWTMTDIKARMRNG